MVEMKVLLQDINSIIQSRKSHNHRKIWKILLKLKSSFDDARLTLYQSLNCGSVLIRHSVTYIIVVERRNRFRIVRQVVNSSY